MATDLGEILYGLYGELPEGTVVVIVRACIDECATHHNEPDAPMLMAATVTTVPRWAIFDAEWKKALKRAGLNYFHTTEIIAAAAQTNSKGDLLRYRNLILRCRDAIVKNIEFSFCTVLEKKDFETYRSDKQLNTILESQYGLSFRVAISFLRMAVPILIPKTKKIFLVIEKGHINCGCAIGLVDRLRAELPDCIIQSPVAYVNGEDSCGAQASDLLAYWALERVERVGDVDYSIIPKEKLAEIHKQTEGPPFYRIPITPEMIAEARDGTIKSRAKFLKRFGHLLSPAGQSS